MIVVAGWLDVAPGMRDRFLSDRSRKIIVTRDEPGCLDYVLSADALLPDRVRVFECWESRDDLEARRSKERSHPLTDPSLKSVAKEIAVFEVDSRRPLD